MYKSINFKLLVCLFAVAVMSGCNKINKVKPLDESLDKSGHLEKAGLVFYTLPMTEVSVEIPVTITVKNGKAAFIESKEGSGDFIDCSETLKKMNYAIEKKITVGEITGSVSSAPDMRHIYAIDLSSSWLRDSTKKLVLTEQNLLSSGSASSKDKTFEFTVQMFKTIVDIASPVMAPMISSAKVTPETTSDCSAALRKVLAERTRHKEEIGRFEKKRLNLLFGENRGGVDTSYDVYKARMAEIDKSINKMKESDSLDKTFVLTFKKRFSGDEVNEGQTVLFWLGDEGFVTPYAGAFHGQGAKQFVSICKVGQGKAVVLNLTRLAADPSRRIAQVTEKPTGEQGLYYRMPAQAEMSFEGAGDASAKKMVQIAQWGTILALPHKLGTLDGTLTFELYVDTGGLKSVGVETKAMDISQVEKAGQAGLTLTNAIIASSDEIARLTREKEKLSLQKDIRDLRQELQTTE